MDDCGIGACNVREPATLRIGTKRLDTASQAKFYTGVPSFALKTGNDGFRVIGGWEHAPVRFSFEGHAALFKPLDGVSGLEPGEGGEQCAGASWIAGGKRTRFETSVGDVAASAPGDTNLGERLVTALSDENARAGARLGCGDGTEITGSAATDHEKVHVLKGRRHRKSLLRHSFA
jgi:hypothetical protein